MFDRLKNFIERRFLNKFYSRKIISIGHSHLLNFRQKYSSISSLSEVDYKIFSQNGEDGIIDYLLHSLNVKSPKFVEIGVGEGTPLVQLAKAGMDVSGVDISQSMVEKAKGNFKNN